MDASLLDSAKRYITYRICVQGPLFVCKEDLDIDQMSLVSMNLAANHRGLTRSNSSAKQFRIEEDDRKANIS